MTQDLFTEDQMLMILTALGKPGIPDPRLLTGLFNLTSAEIRLVQQLYSGHTIAELAQKSGRSVATLRTQLSAVLAGTARQSDLMRLLATLSAP
jgi:DNA-binding CsgD family transcriptional regulator